MKSVDVSSPRPSQLPLKAAVSSTVDVSSPPRVRSCKRVMIHFNDVSLTKQSFAAESDINNIMSNWSRTGILPVSDRVPPSFGDFTGSSDFQELQNRVIAVRTAFDGLPSHVRSRFENDPARLLAFLQDPANAEEAIKLGLVTAPEEPSTAPDATPPQGKGASDAVRPDRVVPKGSKTPSNPPEED